jgi:hypothetical protein
MNPNCPRCKSIQLTWTSTTFSGVAALVIYCQDCGCTVGVLNRN